MRQVINPLIQSVSSEIVLLALLTFTLPGQPTLRVVNNTEDVVSRGDTFMAYPFTLSLPADDSDKLPSLSIQISNVSQDLIEYLRQLPEPPRVLLEIVSNVDFNIVEKSIGFLKLSSVNYDALVITLSMTLDNFLARRFPKEDYIPALFPALFTT
jgi:hypothetical protein